MMGQAKRIIVRTFGWLLVAGCVLPVAPVQGGAYVSAQVQPPPPAREFRGAWIASVYNIDWPSHPGLPVADQKKELTNLLDQAVAMGLNAVILQVRDSADALYESKLDPWSYYLTGRMGQAPKPYYDPLAFAVTEAHKRGLDLHAWFNPFRAVCEKSIPVSPDHISRRRPDLVCNYGTLKWLDPGEPEVREYATQVIVDVTRRYNVDGIHLDDYFYPYPVRAHGEKLSFPDDKSWSRYRASGGNLTRDKWRRQNVNDFVSGLYTAIKQVKPSMKLGISPFGIWKPRVPENTMAYVDSCNDIYADSRLWLQKGWVDYFAPQLYWKIDSPQQSFPLLLNWWRRQNILGRNLWPGIATERVGPDRPAQEILDEIKLTRAQPESAGHIHWSMKNLVQNRRSLTDKLKGDMFRNQALIPAYPWLAAEPLPTAVLHAHEENGSLHLDWKVGEAERGPTRWVLQTRMADGWKTRILSGDSRRHNLSLSDGNPEEIALRPVDSNGNLGTTAGLKLQRLVASVEATSPTVAGR